MCCFEMSLRSVLPQAFEVCLPLSRKMSSYKKKKERRPGKWVQAGLRAILKSSVLY